MNLDTDKLVRITAPHFCAGVVVSKQAAPIVSYMIMWPLEQIQHYCWRKGWTWEMVNHA